LEELNLNFVGGYQKESWVWLPKGQTVRCNQWRKFDRFFSDQTQEVRMLREIIFGKKRNRRFWEITQTRKQCPKIQLGM